MKIFSAAVMLVAAGFLILGWFDHHAAEYDPQHTHLAPGMLGLALDLGIISHEHAFAKKHSHGAQTTPTDASSSGPVVSPAAHLNAIAKGSVSAALPLKPVMPVDLLASDDAPACASPPFSAVDPAPIVPPPRSG